MITWQRDDIGQKNFLVLIHSHSIEEGIDQGEIKRREDGIMMTLSEERMNQSKGKLKGAISCMYCLSLLFSLYQTLYLLPIHLFSIYHFLQWQERRRSINTNQRSLFEENSRRSGTTREREKPRVSYRDNNCEF